MNPIFLNYDFEGYKALAIYEYNEILKKLIFLLKGCFDYEMREVFIYPFKLELKNKYRNFHIIPVPSFHQNDLERGFNHVISIFELLDLPIIDCLIKTENISQHNLNFYQRKNIKKIIKLKEKINLENKKILIVDDIMTTGGTMKSCIEIIEKLNPKEIQILVVAKRILTKEESEKYNNH